MIFFMRGLKHEICREESHPIASHDLISYSCCETNLKTCDGGDDDNLAVMLEDRKEEKMQMQMQMQMLREHRAY